MKKEKLDYQILLRAPKSIYERIEAIAKQNHWSISKTCRKLIEAVLEDTAV